MTEPSPILKAPERARKTVEELVEKFSRNLESYLNPAYKEDQCRIEFINPFFESLGWDTANRQGFAEPYKEVIHEDTLNMAGMTKAPDYSFRVGGARKFFLEAKKPATNLKIDASPAYQLRRYAWSAKLPLSVLTDFEEFAVYDCRIRPEAQDKADAARVEYFNYEKYLDRIDWIYNIFSKEAILKGSFDRFIESARGKRGTSEVDSEFLKEIERWRDTLAKNIALRNPRLDIHPLNDAVQRTIDRIIFLRMAEDRGIESYQQLQGIINGQNIYKRLVELFYQSEDKYNSGLFDFQKDRFTTSLKIDDKILQEIIQDLYYPSCPYEFSVLGADTLGNIYEQFLGKVIRLTPSHQAKVEEKPEVKKAGGVYYTPKYIVDYIVQNTVGKLVEGDIHHRVTAFVPSSGRGEHTEKTENTVSKTPKEISNLKILDPACGSGSFLLGAYQYLLDYHLKWYSENSPEKKNKEIYQGPRGQWLLTTKEKKRILLNNLFGVDIDPQAVEVTKLSLLLKVLENESQESLKKQLQFFKERALPDLDNNIKCGNSLIGPDFYQNQQMALFDEEQKYKINAFDWQAEFPEVFRREEADKSVCSPVAGTRGAGTRGAGTPACEQTVLAAATISSPKSTRRRLPHLQVPAKTYFISFNSKRGPLPPPALKLVVETIKYDEGRRYELDLAVVMPDHVHMIIRPLEKMPGQWFDLSEILKMIKGVSSRKINQFLATRGQLWWDESFDTIINNEDEYQAKVNYILNNPVKAGLVSHSEQYEFFVYPVSADKSVCSPGAGTRGAGTPACEPTADKSVCSPGFDVVIGNPPYVRQETLGEEFKGYAESHFETFAGTADLYVYFIEKAHKLLRTGGCFGMICSNKFMRANYGAALRNFLANKTSLRQIVDFGELPVFQDAATFPAIILTENRAVKEQSFVYAPIKRLSFQELGQEVAKIGNTLDSRALQGDNWTLAKPEEINIIEKMKKQGIPLGEYVGRQIYYGIKTGLNEAFVIDKATRNRLIKEDKKSAELIKPFVVGDDIRKYRIDFKEKYLILIPNGWTRLNCKGSKEPWKWFSKNYPAIAGHLSLFEQKAAKRWDKGEFWWELRPCDYIEKFKGPKIVWPEIAKESRFTFEDGAFYLNKTIFFTPNQDKYLLAILNSSLTWFFLKNLCSVLGDANKGGRLLQQKIYIETVPIRKIDPSSTSEAGLCKRIISLVDDMLALNQKLSSAKTPDEKVRLEREIKATDSEIDRLVYELYGLTEDEIRII